MAPESVDNNQYSKVREYKGKIEKEQLGLYGRFTSVDELAEQVKRHLTSKIRELTEHYKTEDHVEPNHNGIPQQDVDVIDALRGSLASLSAEWKVERDSGPNSVTEGKNVLQKLKQTLLSFRGVLLSLIPAEGISQLDGFMRDANVMQRHQLVLDGGKSFNQFWELGNDLMDKAQQWAETLNKIEFSLGEVDCEYYGSDNAGGTHFTTFDKALYCNCSFRMEILNRSQVKETLKNIRVQVLTVGNGTEKKLKDDQTQRKVAAHYQYDNLCERQVFLEKFRQIILDNLLPLLPKDCIAVL